MHGYKFAWSSSILYWNLESYIFISAWDKYCFILVVVGAGTVGEFYMHYINVLYALKYF